MEYLETSCIILVGGKSVRLRRNKVMETVGSRSLLEQVIHRVSPLCSEIIVVKAQEQTIPRIDPEPKIITDILPKRGPLGGIYSGLRSSGSPYNLVVACDMPLLNQELLRYLLQFASDFDLVVPRLGAKLEPLHAVYAKSCIAPIEHMIEQDNLSVNKLAQSVKTRYVESVEIDRIDPAHLSFFNINTEADLEKARELVGRDE